MKHELSLLVAAAATIACASLPQSVPAQDLPGTSAIASPAIDQWSIFGSGESHRMMVDQTVPGGYAFVVKTAAAGQNPWDVQAAVATAQPIHSGDVILLAFWAKALATPPGQPAISVIADIQQNHAPYTRIGDRALNVGTTWKLYYVSGTSTLDLTPAEAAATVQLATGAQEIALGPVFVRNFGPGYDLARLPVN